LGDVRYFPLQARELERQFHVFVDLPEDYSSTQSRYPVVYLLDGGNTFPLVAALHHYLRFSEESPAIVLVGISYGADTFRQGNWRQTDFTAPASQRSFWGGAGAFQRLLSEELMPEIESRFRIDPGKRILFGHSLGGQFVLFNALTRPALFHAHIAGNPALQLNLPFFLEWRGGDVQPTGITQLFVGLSEQELPALRTPLLKWQAHWLGKDTSPWSLEFRILAGQTHMSAVPEVFRQGLHWVFRDDNGGIDKQP
jgi:predicted alpha/beta superfamily hydrolase